MRQNWVLLLFLSLAAVIVWAMGCVYLRERGYPGLCALLFIVLALVYVYFRAAARPGARR